MKSIKNIFILAIITSIISLSSCKKDKDEIVTNASMTATVDQTSWVTVTRLTKHFTSPASFVITGTTLSGEVLVITVKGDVVGHYISAASIDSANAQVGCVWQPDASSPSNDNFLSKNGTVDITDIDNVEKKITGTFSFDLIKTDSLGYQTAKTITDGKFTSLSYSE